MTTLQEWKKAKQEEFLVGFWSHRVSRNTKEAKYVADFLDTSFDELIALVEQEAEIEMDKTGTLSTVSKQRMRDLLSRLRGETNDQIL